MTQDPPLQVHCRLCLPALMGSREHLPTHHPQQPCPVTLASVSLCPRGSPLHGLLGNSRPTRTRRRALQRPASANCLAPLNLLSPASRLIAVLAPAAQTVKPRTYTGDERRPCARTARKFVKRSLRFDIYTLRASLVAQLVKNLPAMPETWVRSLGWEDPLEKGKAIPTPVFWPGEFHGLYSPWGRKQSAMPERYF